MTSRVRPAHPLVFATTGSGIESGVMENPPGIADPAVAARLGEAIELLRGKRAVAITGAGISHDSGIPTYRGFGSSPRTPMTIERFMADPETRARFWVGSQLGWRRFAMAQPNDGHRALARLERDGNLAGVITQNVDGLHDLAGSHNVIALHGTNHTIVCTNCRERTPRRDFTELTEQLNPWVSGLDHGDLGPDGDVKPESYQGYIVPECASCGGILKPDIVFFGEYVPTDRFDQAAKLVSKADALIVAGTSLAVNSAVRLVTRAVRRGTPAIVINVEPAKMDARARLLVRAGTSESLVAIACALGVRPGTPERW